MQSYITENPTIRSLWGKVFYLTLIFRNKLRRNFVTQTSLGIISDGAAVLRKLQKWRCISSVGWWLRYAKTIENVSNNTRSYWNTAIICYNSRTELQNNYVESYRLRSCILLQSFECKSIQYYTIFKTNFVFLTFFINVKHL